MNKIILFVFSLLFMMAASQAETKPVKQLNTGLTKEDFNQMMRVNAPAKTVKRERITIFHKRTAWDMVKDWYFSVPRDQRRTLIFSASFLLLLVSIWQMRSATMRRVQRKKINLQDSVWNADRNSATNNLRELEEFNQQKKPNDQTRDFTK